MGRTKGAARGSGYTLIELLVVMGIIVALATLALAGFSAFTTQRGFRTAARMAANTFRTARQLAIADRQPVYVEVVDVSSDTDPTNDESSDRVIVYKAQRTTDDYGRVSDVLIRQVTSMEGNPPHCRLQDVKPVAIEDLPDRVYWSLIPGFMTVKEEQLKLEVYKALIPNPDYNPDDPASPKEIQGYKERVSRKVTMIVRPFFKFNPDGTVESEPTRSPPTKEYPASAIRMWDQASDQEAQIYISPSTGYVKEVYREHPVVPQGKSPTGKK